MRLSDPREIPPTRRRRPFRKGPRPKLTRADVEALYGDMLRRGLSPRTIRYAHSVLRAALNNAEDAGKIGRNPTTRVKLPALHRREARHVGGEIAARFIRVAEADDFAALWLLLTTTGARPGEALALRWTDIDGDVAHIRRTLILVNGERSYDVPKTAGSARTLPIVQEVQRALRAHRARQAQQKLAAGEYYQDEALIFAGPTGGPLDENGVRQRLQRMLAKAGSAERDALEKARGTGDPTAIRAAEGAARVAELPRLRLYDLRHMCATVGMERGVHIKAVADLLGHSTPALALSTYSHASVGQRELAVKAITEGLFTGTDSQR